jgi:hypothetical protein
MTKRGPTVRLKLRVRTDKGFRYVNPVFEGKTSKKDGETSEKGGEPRQKLKYGYAWIGREQKKFSEANYVLRYQENGKRKYESLTCAPDLILRRLQTKKLTLAAKANGIDLINEDGVPTSVVDTVTSVKEAVKECLEEIKPAKTLRNFQEHVKTYIAEKKLFTSHKTFLAHQIALKGFAVSCRKQNLEDLDRQDLLDYIRL